MQSFISTLQDILIHVKGKPFSYSLKILGIVVAAFTAITVPNCGLIWTGFFAVFIAFCGASAFLLLIDDQNGGIVGELQRLLHLIPLPFLEKFLPRSDALASRLLSREASPVPKDPRPANLLTSKNLERIYPWLNLTLPKVLDDSLTRLMEIIINDYMTKDWYALVQVRKNFANEARVAIRYCASRLARRLSVVNAAGFIHHTVCRAVVEHISVFLTLRKVSAASGEQDVVLLLKKHPELAHPAMRENAGDSEEDLFYFRISTKILNYLLPREFRRFQASAAVLREVLTELVLKNVVDAFSEPHRLNYLFHLALTYATTSIEPATPTPPADLSEVPILKRLVSEEKPTSTVQKVPFRQILKEATLKNSFEQHLKALEMEEFCKIHESISWINKFLDSPVLGEAAVMSTYNSLTKLQRELQLAEEKGYTFPVDFLADVGTVCSAGPSAIPRLRQLPSWKNMNEQLTALFDGILVPTFQETRLYHHLMMPPTEEVSRTRERQIKRGLSRHRAPHPEALRLLGETVRGVLKDVTPVVDNLDSESYDDFDGSSGLPDDDFDDLDSELPPISEDSLGSTLRDLSYYDLSVLRAEKRRDDRGRIFMILNITVFDRGPLSPDMNKRWAVQRKYSEFYILDSKIREFHGTLEASSFLPAKKAWSQPSLEFLQQRVGDFEKFLQFLVREPKLRYSQMLYNFLATTMEFDQTGFPDLGLGKAIRNVPQILTQERGQNIESFVRSLLNIALPAAKSKPLNDMPLAKDDPPPSFVPPPVQTHFQPVPFDPPTDESGESAEVKTNSFETVFSELIYLATTFLKVDPEMLGVVACCQSLAAPLVEDACFRKITEFVDFVTHPEQMAFLFDLLSQTLTSAYPPLDPDTIEKSARETLEQFLVLARTPWAEIVCGGGAQAENVARLAFDLFQYKALNKRLVMILLDLIVVKLFPELEGAPVM